MEINPTVWDFTISPFGSLEDKINEALPARKHVRSSKTPPAKNTINLT